MPGYLQSDCGAGAGVFGNPLALHIETKRKPAAKQARKLLRKASSVELLDEEGYPSAVSEAAGEDAVFVGRVREDVSHLRGLDLWMMADNAPQGRGAE